MTKLAGIAPLRVLQGSSRVVLANKGLRRVAETWFLWVIGEWAFLVLLSVTAYHRGGTAAVGVIGAVRMIPGALASTPLSITADRFPRAHVLVAVLLSWVLLVASVPLTLRGDSLLALYVVVGIASVTAALLRPTVNALVPQVAGRPEELAGANSAYSFVEAAGSLVGPLAAGLLVALAGTTARYIAVAAVFGVAATLGAGIRTEFQPAQHERLSGWRRLLAPAAGFSALGGSRPMRGLLIVFIAQTMTRGLLNVFVVAMAVSLLSSGLSSTGPLFAAVGAGGVAGAVVSLFGTNWRPDVPFVLGMSLWGLPLIVIVVGPNVVVAWAALAAVGLGNALGDVFGLTFVHRLVPDHLLGRAFGAFWAIASAAQATGAVLAAPLINGLGLQGAMVAVGIAMTVIALSSWISVRRLDGDLSTTGSAMDTLQSCRLLAPLTRIALEQLARKAVALDVPAGTVLIRQGEAAETFFVVESGELIADVDGEVVRQLLPGDCFGEIAAIRHTRRTASVAAVSPTRLLRLTGADFVLAVTGHQVAQRETVAMVDERFAYRHPPPR